jgi:hypothetical protein
MFGIERGSDGACQKMISAVLEEAKTSKKLLELLAAVRTKMREATRT